MRAQTAQSYHYWQPFTPREIVYVRGQLRIRRLNFERDVISTGWERPGLYLASGNFVNLSFKPLRTRENHSAGQTENSVSAGDVTHGRIPIALAGKSDEQIRR